jgi:hypothetical protein
VTESGSDAAQQLHPTVLHHLVNTLGWSGLRPAQQAAVGPLLAGDDLVMVAPAAGGKTEAAMLRLLSRMVEQDWTGTSVLYLCPPKALLNNLLPRLERYADWLGRRAAIWHGDTTAAQRRKAQYEQPDILRTTPESLGAMLVSATVDHATFFGNVRAVVVDEIHAFAGDDRGRHLLAVLERLAGSTPPSWSKRSKDHGGCCSAAEAGTSRISTGSPSSPSCGAGGIRPAGRLVDQAGGLIARVRESAGGRGAGRTIRRRSPWTSLSAGTAGARRRGLRLHAGSADRAGGGGRSGVGWAPGATMHPSSDRSDPSGRAGPQVGVYRPGGSTRRRGDPLAHPHRTGSGSARPMIRTRRDAKALVSTDCSETAEHHASTTVPRYGIHGTIVGHKEGREPRSR